MKNCSVSQVKTCMPRNFVETLSGVNASVMFVAKRKNMLRALLSICVTLAVTNTLGNIYLIFRECYTSSGNFSCNLCCNKSHLV